MPKTKKEISLKPNLELIDEIAKELLSLMGTSAKSSVSLDEANDGVLVTIETDAEKGLLIGNRGDTLNSLQGIISLIYRQKTGEWVRILVDIGDYRSKQEDYLKNLARETADRAIETNQKQELYNLTPAQRRVVHIELSKNDKVETESVGEDRDRYLVVKPKA